MKRCRVSLILTALMVMAGVSCSKSLESKDLNANYNKWTRTGIQEYEYSLAINCFCSTDRTGPHIIRVNGDLIATVNGNSYDITKTGTLYTVPQLFNLIRESIARKPYRITVEYDNTYGFPKKIYIDYDQNIADEEVGFTLTGFRKIR